MSFALKGADVNFFCSRSCRSATPTHKSSGASALTSSPRHPSGCSTLPRSHKSSAPTFPVHSVDPNAGECSCIHECCFVKTWLSCFYFFRSTKRSEKLFQSIMLYSECFSPEWLSGGILLIRSCASLF